MSGPAWDALLATLDHRQPGPVTGLHTTVQPRRGDLAGWPPVSPIVLTARFAHRPPGDWLLDFGNGDIGLQLPRAGAEVPSEELEFGPDFPWDLDAGPARLLCARASTPVLAAAVPLAPPEPQAHDGRNAWAVTLRTPELAHPLRVVLDPVAGLLLQAEVPALGYRETLTGLEFPPSLPDSAFDRSAEVDAATARHERLAAYWADRPLPLPGHWPGGMARTHAHVLGGDPETGLLAVQLTPDDDAREAAPADLPPQSALIRRPLGAPPFEPGWTADPETYVHHWSTARWHWTAAFLGRPLTPVELACVIATMPPD